VAKVGTSKAGSRISQIGCHGKPIKEEEEEEEEEARHTECYLNCNTAGYAS
jgi:hypothetical protein